MKAAVVAAWNELVEKRDEMLVRWESMVAEGNALERYRAKQMIAVTAEGPLDGEVPELTRMFLEKIVIHSPDEMTVAFLDGSRVTVCFQTGTAKVA